LTVALGACRGPNDRERAQDKPNATAAASATSRGAGESGVPAGAALRTESHDPPPRGGERALPSLAVAEPNVQLPPAPPDIEPQLLACGKRGFVRLTHDGFEAYATSPPKRVARAPLDQPRNVIQLAGDSSLVIARSGVFRYYHGEKAARRFTRIPILGPLQAWSDPQNIDGFWVRYLRDPALHHFTLEDDAPPTAKGPLVESSERAVMPKAVTIGEVVELAEFDFRLFTVLRDGSPFYSTVSGLLKATIGAPRLSPWPQLTRRLAALWPGSTQDRYWAADESGAAWQFELGRGEPRVMAVQFAGLPIAIAHQGDLVAVASAALTRGERTRELEVFRGQKRLAQLRLPAGLTESRPAAGELDLCLLDGKPWVVVGSRTQLLVYDYARRAVVESWGG
jgi:hypothetical protein